MNVFLILCIDSLIVKNWTRMLETTWLWLLFLDVSPRRTKLYHPNKRLMQLQASPRLWILAFKDEQIPDKCCSRCSCSSSNHLLNTYADFYHHLKIRQVDWSYYLTKQEFTLQSAAHNLSWLHIISIIGYYISININNLFDKKNRLYNIYRLWKVNSIHEYFRTGCLLSESYLLLAYSRPTVCSLYCIAAGF